MDNTADPRLELSLNRDALAHLLLGSDEFEAPARILSGLSGEQACVQLPGVPWSIAGLLAHMIFWQERRLGWAQGLEQPDFGPEQNFPQVSAEQWPGLVQRFLEGFAALEALATPENSARQLYRGRSVGFMLASQSCHSAYHLGQIVLLRRLQGLWPPPAEQ
ncbi:DinB family protein [bacterium]|nr:DinB family protein [bacterium]